MQWITLSHYNALLRNLGFWHLFEIYFHIPYTPDEFLTPQSPPVGKYILRQCRNPQRAQSFDTALKLARSQSDLAATQVLSPCVAQDNFKVVADWCIFKASKMLLRYFLHKLAAERKSCGSLLILQSLLRNLKSAMADLIIYRWWVAKIHSWRLVYM